MHSVRWMLRDIGQGVGLYLSRRTNLCLSSTRVHHIEALLRGCGEGLEELQSAVFAEERVACDVNAEAGHARSGC